MGQAREIMDRLTSAATEAHDVNQVVDLYTPNAVVMTPDAGKLTGPEQIAGYWQLFVDGFPDGRYESISKLEVGNKAVDEGYFVATHNQEMRMPSGETLRPTGNTIRVRSCDVATVENGKITEHHLYFDEVEFMRQLGLAS